VSKGLPVGVDDASYSGMEIRYRGLRGGKSGGEAGGGTRMRLDKKAGAVQHANFNTQHQHSALGAVPPAEFAAT